MRSLIVLALLFCTGQALAQYRCDVGGRKVVQTEPCAPEPGHGKYRCYIDDELKYSDTPCSTIKSKKQLKQEEESKRIAEIAEKNARARQLEAKDAPNFPGRIARAKQAVASMLRDPDSARFGDVRVSWYTGAPVVCGKVTGKNAFNGYADPKYFYVVAGYPEIQSADKYDGFLSRYLDNCGRPEI